MTCLNRSDQRAQQLSSLIFTPFDAVLLPKPSTALPAAFRVSLFEVNAARSRGRLACGFVARTVGCRRVELVDGVRTGSFASVIKIIIIIIIIIITIIPQRSL